MNKIIFLAVLFSNNLYSHCLLNGQFKITGDWTSFKEWYLEFKDNKLINSYTDNSPSQDWQSTLEIQYQKLIKISQTTYAIDGIIESNIYLNIIGCNVLSINLGYETYIDETNIAGDAVFRTKNLKIEVL